jgi:hypothetical protein
MGQKSGRNGAPAPKSRVSLSESEPGVKFCSLGMPTESLACFSGFAVHLSALLCALAHFFCARVESLAMRLRAKHGESRIRMYRDTPKEKEDYCADVFTACTDG